MTVSAEAELPAQPAGRDTLGEAHIAAEVLADARSVVEIMGARAMHLMLRGLASRSPHSHAGAVCN